MFYLFLSFDTLWCVLRKKILNKIFKIQNLRLTFYKKIIKIFIFLIFLFLKVPSNEIQMVYHSIHSDELTMNDFNSFTTNAFLDLETKVYGDNWSIPYKR